MNESQAISAAEAARKTPGGPAGGDLVPSSAQLASVRRRYIELTADNGPPAPRVPLKDLLVWIAHFGIGNGWIELALAEPNGELVRVERSRALFPEEIALFEQSQRSDETPPDAKSVLTAGDRP